MRFVGKTAALHTLGCKVNEYETDAMRASLEEAGFTIVDFCQKADVYVINTCSVTNIADRKSRQMISRARKLSPDAVVVAAGCYVQTALEKTGKSVDADILLGSGRKSALVEELERYFLQKHKENAVPEGDPLSCAGDIAQEQPVRCVSDVMRERDYDALSLPRIEGHTRAWIKVQDGCNLFCSYCIIPFARGRIRSRRREEVLEEVSNLASQGIREIVLTGIHLSSYGVDFGGDIRQAYGERGEKRTWQERSRLIDLIEGVCGIDGIERVRLGSLEPTIITEQFVERLRALPEVCPHFHLSLQSGCDSVLRRMNRHYTTEEYLHSLELLRNAYDMPAITTDVIVGFPGESGEEFALTRQFLERAHFYETHLFRYSRRAGTKAAAMPDQIPESVSAERLAALAELDRKMRKMFEQSRDGSEAEVLFEEEVQIDENGTVRTPNSGSLAVTVQDLNLPSAEGERLYTGYTREYIRVYARSAQDLRGQIRSGTLRGPELIL